MNYLGHLYLSGNDKSLMVANLFGDFVKGKKFTHLPTIVREGVTLHREIDHFIDTHKEVAKLRAELYKPLPKVAGIAIDLYFDHLLAKKWHHFHKETLNDFVDDFFQYVEKLNRNNFQVQDFNYPENYIYLLKVMRENKWIRRYKEEEGLIMASSGLSKRISFSNRLGDAPKIFRENNQQIEQVFLDFMKEAEIYFGVKKT